MNKSYRIKTEVGTNADKHIKLKLEQEFERFEILSLQIDQKDNYQNFNCDFGVIVGRVLANGGIGVPNAKLSIFIPLSDDDELRPEIKALYPYKTPRQQNSNGKRYNLLPRVSEQQADGTFKPEQAFGSFPTKTELLVNDNWLEVYETYYKYNAVTNESGDFMMFGVPVGTQTVHMSADITDIGEFSMTPPTMINNLGYSPNLFNEDGTRIKNQRDLDDLVNIDTQEIAVDVIPFCGDSDNFDIGITRQDFRIRAELLSTFTIFGTTFTNAFEAIWGNDLDGNNSGNRGFYPAEYYYEGNPNTFPRRPRNAAIFRNTPPKIRVYSLSPNVTETQINDVNYTPNFETDFIKLSNTEYGEFLRDGDFVLNIPCNRDKVITDENGIKTPVPNDSPNGVFTKFVGFITIEYDELPIADSNNLRNIVCGLYGSANLVGRRARYKIPQGFNFNQNMGDWFNNPFGAQFLREERLDGFKRDTFTFETGKFYSISRFQGIVYNFDEENYDSEDSPLDPQSFINLLFPTNSFGLLNNINNISLASDVLNYISNEPNQAIDRTRTVGLIDTNGVFKPNRVSNPNVENSGWFGANWLNFALHLEQQHFTNSPLPQPLRINNQSLMLFLPNEEPFVAGDLGTHFYSRSDLNKTRFIEVPRDDLVTIRNFDKKAFSSNDIQFLNGTNYKRGSDTDTPLQGGFINGNPSTGQKDINAYFFLGLDETNDSGDANCVEYLFELGLIQ